MKTECVGSQVGGGPSALRREQGLQEREAGGERGWVMPSMMWGVCEDENGLERGNARGCNSRIIAGRSVVYEMQRAAVIFSARSRKKRQAGGSGG